METNHHWQFGDRHGVQRMLDAPSLLYGALRLRTSAIFMIVVWKGCMSIYESLFPAPNVFAADNYCVTFYLRLIKYCLQNRCKPRNIDNIYL